MNVIFAVIFHYTVVSLLSYNKILIYLSSYPSIYLSIYLSAYLSSSYQVKEEEEGQEVGRNVPPHGYYLSIYLPISLTR